MCNGVGGIALTYTAAHILNESNSFFPQHLQKILLIVIDLAMVQARQDQVSLLLGMFSMLIHEEYYEVGR